MRSTGPNSDTAFSSSGWNVTPGGYKQLSLLASRCPVAHNDAGGGLAFALATLSGVRLGKGDTAASTPPAGSSSASSRFPDVGGTDVAYEPGHSSGWHVHPGVHSVVVLPGNLTVYDADCRRHAYGPGQTYLGGDIVHIAAICPDPLDTPGRTFYRRKEKGRTNNGGPALPEASALR